MNNPLVRIPRLVPVAEKVNQLRRQVEGELRSFDIIRWDGTPYGLHPLQCMDISEVNDLCPRDGWPTVLCIHGGGWIEGDKSQYVAMLPQFARRKIMAASMNYRLAPEVTWKEQVEDVLKALDFILSQQVDKQRVALWATSAGAHLALLVAALRPEQLRCVVTIGAATHPPELDIDLVREAFPDIQDPACSPHLQCHRLPKTLMLHGELDPVIPLSQHSQFCADRSDVTSWVLKDGDHHLRWPIVQGWRMRQRALNWLVQEMNVPTVGSKWRRRKKK